MCSLAVQQLSMDTAQPAPCGVHMTLFAAVPPCQRAEVLRVTVYGRHMSCMSQLPVAACHMCARLRSLPTYPPCNCDGIPWIRPGCHGRQGMPLQLQDACSCPGWPLLADGHQQCATRFMVSNATLFDCCWPAVMHADVVLLLW